MFYVMSLLAIYAVVPITGSSEMTEHSMYVFGVLQLANGILCYACATLMSRCMSPIALNRFWFIR